ncbi:peptidoglycan-associated lipoprotein [Microbulbifer aestuariivivens]|uniref:Peptidoglycan-associated lipoprotein n=1 Tax=Microbulbifer aestuariivivens TaxID=1908308 RepID=A0ABP9WQB4_9GAMM
MADNFLEMTLNQLGSQGLSALGSAVGLPEDKQQEAFRIGGATLLAGVLNKGTSKSGMASVFIHATDNEHLDFSSVADVVEDPAMVGELQRMGGGIVEGVFGGKSSHAMNLLASALNVDDKTGSRLLKILAPLFMSQLGKVVKNHNMDVSDLASYLFAQKEFIKDKLPDGLLKEIGVIDFSSLSASLETHGHSQPLEPRPKEVRQAERVRAAFAKWFWLVIIVLIVLYALNMCAKFEVIDEDVVEEEVVLGEQAILEEQQAMTAGDAEAVVSEGFAGSFRDYLQSDARDPEREFPLTIEFAQSSAIPGSESVPDVDELVAILQENDGMTIAIEGHTSSEGDEVRNQALSQQRAEAVRQILIDRGIDAARITATGMGSTKPIADNSSEEGKQRNRRITVRVVTFE